MDGRQIACRRLFKRHNLVSAQKRIVKKEEAVIPMGLMPSITGLSDIA
jgi:hypothetical protein